MKAGCDKLENCIDQIPIFSYRTRSGYEKYKLKKKKKRNKHTPQDLYADDFMVRPRKAGFQNCSCSRIVPSHGVSKSEKLGKIKDYILSQRRSKHVRKFKEWISR